MFTPTVVSAASSTVQEVDHTSSAQSQLLSSPLPENQIAEINSSLPHELGFQCKYAKHIINELDVDNFYCKYTTIGRDVLDGKYECIVNETRFYLKGNGCIYKMTTHVHPLPRTEFNEEGPKMGQEKMKKMFKVVEEYLIAHPSAYP
ncbi:hypothetical protein Ancab_019533 [Ancistrocladus abbreviatus]